jgi:hypothetical protein
LGVATLSRVRKTKFKRRVFQMRGLTTQRRTGKTLVQLVTLAIIFALAATPAFAATGTMDIGGTKVSGLGSDRSGTGWSWNASTGALTLDNTYTGEVVAINCATSDSIDLVYSGDVRLFCKPPQTTTVPPSAPVATIPHSFANPHALSPHALSCAGNLSINGSGGTLTVEFTDTGSSAEAIHCEGVLSIGGNAVVDATSASPAPVSGSVYAVIWGQYGVNISDSASVTATATGSVFSGIVTGSGDITISTSGTVVANRTGTGTRAIGSIDDGSLINVTGGGTVTANGNLQNSLAVSGAGANVTVNGDIASGDLTVSDGTVTVTGTVAGSINVTGGTVSVNGQTITPATTPSGGSGGGCDAGAGILGAFGAMVLFASRRRARG